MLHNAPALLAPGREGRRPTRNPEQVLKGPRRAVPVGLFEFIP
jgi:hypothetical protein